MRWTYETYTQEDKRLAKWHRRFAWFPVAFEGKAWWLCRVWARRKDVLHAPLLGTLEKWEYKDANE